MAADADILEKPLRSSCGHSACRAGRYLGLCLAATHRACRTGDCPCARRSRYRSGLVSYRLHRSPEHLSFRHRSGASRQSRCRGRRCHRHLFLWGASFRPGSFHRDRKNQSPRSAGARRRFAGCARPGSVGGRRGRRVHAAADRREERAGYARDTRGHVHVERRFKHSAAERRDRCLVARLADRRKGSFAAVCAAHPCWANVRGGAVVFF